MRTLAVLALLAGLTGCGYAFVGRKDALPTGGRRVFAPTFGNSSSEAGAEGYFTEAFREELANAGAAGTPDSPVIAKGQITGIAGSPGLVFSNGQNGAIGIPGPTTTDAPTPLNPEQQKLFPAGQFFASYHVDVGVCVTLLEGTTSLAAACVGGSEDYATGPDPLAVEAARRTALRRLAKRLMRDCMERLSTGF